MLDRILLDWILIIVVIIAGVQLTMSNISKIVSREAHWMIMYFESYYIYWLNGFVFNEIRATETNRSAVPATSTENHFTTNTTAAGFDSPKFETPCVSTEDTNISKPSQVRQSTLKFPNYKNDREQKL